MNAACCRTTHPPYQVQSQNPLRAEERDFSATSPLMIFCRELSRYLRLAAWPSLCAGTVIPRNARCAPLFRAAYPNLAIRALGCTRLRVRCRDRRREFRFGRRATSGCRLWIDQGSSCNRQLDRRNRLRDRCRQGRLAILDHRSGGKVIRRQAGVGSARGLQQGVQTKSQTCPTAQ
jgi:hypothetical protein